MICASGSQKKHEKNAAYQDGIALNAFGNDLYSLLWKQPNLVLQVCFLSLLQNKKSLKTRPFCNSNGQHAKMKAEQQSRCRTAVPSRPIAPVSQQNVKLQSSYKH